MFLAEYGASRQRVADYGRIYEVQYQSCSPSARDGMGDRRPIFTHPGIELGVIDTNCLSVGISL
jgi:hypothetical protein